VVKKNNHKKKKNAANWKQPFQQKKTREANQEWQKLKTNFKPRIEYVHEYLGTREVKQKEYFESRVVFIE